MSVGKKVFPGQEYPAGIGYVIWPSDISREEYVRKCLSTFTVSMVTEDGGVRNRVPFAMSCADDIAFPEANDQYGSIVFWVLNTVMKQPIIVAVMKPPQAVGDLTEHFFKWKKEYRDSFVEISGSAKDKVINTVINVKEGGVYNLSVKNNKRSNALINVEVTGSIKALSTENTELHQYKEFVVRTASQDDKATYSSFKQTSDQQTFTTERIEFLKRENTGETEPQPFVLGDVFKQLFDEFIDEVARTTVSTALGQMPILNAVQVALFKERTEQILSQLTFSE